MKIIKILLKLHLIQMINNLPLNKPLKLHLLTIIVKYIFEEDVKFYLQLYLDDSLFKLRV